MDFVMRHLIDFALSLLVLAIAVTVRGLVQATASAALGDFSAMRAGRISLNPFRHFNPGRALLMAISSEIILWPVFSGRELPLNPQRWKDSKWLLLLVYLSGAIACLTLSFVMSWLIFKKGILAGKDVHYSYFVYGLRLALIAVGLFHLIPLPPMDGYKIICLWLSPEKRMKWDRLEGEAMLYHGLTLIFVIAPLTTLFSLITARVFY